MTALPPHDADRFAKLLGMLGSSHDGECLSAARRATEFLAARKLGWPDIGEMLKHPPVLYQPEPVAAPALHQADARACLSSSVVWKAHELEFLHQMASQRRRPTERQRDWLDGLFDRAMRERRRA